MAHESPQQPEELSPMLDSVQKAMRHELESGIKGEKFLEFCVGMSGFPPVLAGRIDSENAVDLIFLVFNHDPNIKTAFIPIVQDAAEYLANFRNLTRTWNGGIAYEFSRVCARLGWPGNTREHVAQYHAYLAEHCDVQDNIVATRRKMNKNGIARLLGNKKKVDE